MNTGKKKKMLLNKISVQSFTTALKKEEKETVNGEGGGPPPGATATPWDWSIKLSAVCWVCDGVLPYEPRGCGGPSACWNAPGQMADTCGASVKHVIPTAVQPYSDCPITVLQTAINGAACTYEHSPCANYTDPNYCG